MMEKGTKITRLRNIMTPVVNYFKMLKHLEKGDIDKTEVLIKLIIKERINCLGVIDEITEIVKMIPNDAIKEENDEK